MPADIDRIYAVAKWWQHMQDTNNAAFLPLLADQHRYLVMMGGGGSGKSIFAGRKVLERVTSEPGHRWLVVRKVAKTLRESCFRQLLGQLADHYADVGYKANKSDMLISFANGSEIIFAGLDDVEKLKSIYNITGIWIEEASELLEADFNQLDIRLRGESRYYKQIILSFNPISILHWLKKRFFDRREPRARTHRSTYKDNRFLPEEDIQTLLAFRDTDPYHYMVYALGEWGVVGKTVFDAEKVTAQLLLDVQPIRRGYYEYDISGSIEDKLRVSNIRWVEDKHGAISIYAEVDAGRPYVLGGDTAGDGSDKFAGQVIDNVSTKQMAVLHHQYDEDLYTLQMYCLGMEYNHALIGIESNFSSYPNKVLAALGYRNLYLREVEDTYTGKLTQAYGVQTTSKTRPVMISGLVKAVREDAEQIVDRGTLEEMLTFVRDEHFRAEAEEGAHDDLVMALAIAHYIRTQGSFEVKGAARRKKAVWTRDMWEDYKRGSRQMQDEMIKQWGDPF